MWFDNPTTGIYPPQFSSTSLIVEQIPGLSFNVYQPTTANYTPTLFMGRYARGAQTGIFLTPVFTGTTTNTKVVDFYSFGNFGVYPCLLLGAHSGRIFMFGATVNAFYDATSPNYLLFNDEAVFVDTSSAGPQLLFSQSVLQVFDPERSGGYGAWGSVSTGELFLVRRGGGAVVVNGDPAYPSSVIALPAVVGTGRISQQGTMTVAGIVYVTEQNGIYAWNGGNTANKISEQIPDDATVRYDLFNAVGPKTWHCMSNDLVFFPHNWVWDSVNNSWWQLDNPSTVDLGAFVKSGVSSQVFATTGLPTGSPAVSFGIYNIDFAYKASTWVWQSNPIPASIGALTTLQFVEIVASNPTAAAATITITPTGANANYNISGDNTQAITFTIPSHSNNVRLSARLGYNDYNLQVNVSAANSTSTGAVASQLAAPVLHDLILGYKEFAPTGLNV